MIISVLQEVTLAAAEKMVWREIGEPETDLENSQECPAKTSVPGIPGLNETCVMGIEKEKEIHYFISRIYGIYWKWGG